jgi:hypothetical protein
MSISPIPRMPWDGLDKLTLAVTTPILYLKRTMAGKSAVNRCLRIAEIQGKFANTLIMEMDTDNASRIREE